ncbi:MAG: hypothetical protein M3P83_08000 [Actinomycetota bacterium]|nr:hypothetical protein [Actinomycetota bacterium]
MARRVVFHIGAPKTGTTFLQTVMWHNRPRLREQGVLYPGDSRMDHFRASEVVRGLHNRRVRGAGASWERLASAIDEWPHTGLISHEFFGAATAEQAERAIERLRPADVHLVFTARDYVRQFPAVWQEALKMRADASLDEFMDRTLRNQVTGPWSWVTQDMAAILQRWARTVEPACVHVVTVPPPGAPRDLLWQRWCTVLGIDPSSCELDVAFGNESLGVRQAALMHRVKPHLSGPLLEGPNRYRWVRQYLGHEVLVPQGGERFGVREHHARALRARSVEAVRSVREAGYDVVGDLQELIPPEPPAPVPNPADVTDEELVEVAVVAIEQMVRDMLSMTRDRDQWRGRARRAEKQLALRPPPAYSTTTLARVRRWATAHDNTAVRTVRAVYRRVRR